MDDQPTFDVDCFVSIPRVTSLAVAPDGSRLVASVQRVATDGKKYVTSLWEMDPRGETEARQLTRSAPGESHAAFLPDGSVLFTSTRPDPDARDEGKDDDKERSRLWLLPAAGGEPRVVAAPPGGVTGAATARDAGRVVYGVPVWPGAASADDDEARQQARTEAGVTAQLFDGYPIRFWDHYLGPRKLHLFVADPPPANGTLDEPQDLVADPGIGFSDPQGAWTVTPDGGTVIATWWLQLARGEERSELVAFDIARGTRRVLVSRDRTSFGAPAVSWDGTKVAFVGNPYGTLTEPFRIELLVTDLATGETRELGADVDVWFAAPVWSHDGRAVFAVADQLGHAPIFRVDVETGAVTRLTASGCHTALSVGPDGTVYALRSDLTGPHRAVAVDPTAADQEPATLRTPGHPLSVAPPGRVEELVAEAPDGTAVRAWLVLPAGASEDSPAPLATFIHGGPVAAWGEWSWRWNPQLLAARGWAVVLPNPALSTGFGHAFVQRGWGRWGAEPFTDIMAVVDAACARPDIDEQRTAALGPSFGGYMANWVAGHTDRFKCIVSHAGIWSLEQFHGTTDLTAWWEYEFGDPDVDNQRYVDNSPDRHTAAITTPMLVVHGRLDERVPVSEGLHLWTDLVRYGVDAKLLYFPDENHWILKPPNVRVWHEAVFAWLDHHVLGEGWKTPPLL